MTAKTLLTLLGVTLVISSRAASVKSPAASEIREAPQIMAPHGLGVGRLIPDMELEPVSGKSFRLSELKPARAIVIAFISGSCPLSKRYAPTLAKLERDYAERGVQFVFIDPLTADTAEQIAETIHAHGFKGEFIRDTDREI